eukprot:9308506-Alexandrium_andersonii.AAC.1
MHEPMPRADIRARVMAPSRMQSASAIIRSGGSKERATPAAEIRRRGAPSKVREPQLSGKGQEPPMQLWRAAALTRAAE